METANNPGYKTSEFWLTVASSLIGVALMLGKLTPYQAQALNDQTPTIMGAILTLVMSFSYVLTRFGLKHAAVTLLPEPDLNSEPSAPDPGVTQPAPSSLITQTVPQPNTAGTVVTATVTPSAPQASAI